MVLRRQDKRGLTTLLFTDIVGSSEVATELGDRRWKTLQARHHTEVRRHLKRYDGHEVDTAGDGFFATFRSPESGVRCAFAIVQGVRELGLDVRAGLHIGVADLSGEKVSGIAVTTAARVSAAAGPGQVLATDTIVHMVAGSGFEFTDIGSRELKGVPGSWELFDLDAVDGESIGPPLDPRDARAAWGRWSPPGLQKRARLRTAPLVIASVLVALTTALLVARNHPASTAQSAPTSTPTSGPVPELISPLEDKSGAQAFSIDLSTGSTYFYRVGPVAFTGRSSTPTAFAWVPTGRQYELQVTQLNREYGAISDRQNSEFFRTGLGAQRGTTCVCLAAASDRIWTPLTFPGPQNGVVLRGIGLEGQPEKDIVVDRALPPGGVAAFVSGGGDLWVGDSFDDGVYRVDPASSAVSRFQLRQGADLMVFAEGNLWVLDTNRGHLTRVDPRSGRSTPSFQVPGDLHGMTVGGGSVWVADATGKQIWQIPKNLGSPATSISMAQFGGSPNAVTYDDGAIVVGFTDGTVAKINPTNPSAPAVLWRNRVGNNAESITVYDGVVWVAGGPSNI